MEINPNFFAAPRERPPGMHPKVPYQPVLQHRFRLGDRITQLAIAGYYDSGAYKVPHLAFDWLRRNGHKPVLGTPGTPQPDAPGAYRVAVVGDMGEGSPAEVRTAKQMLRWAPTHVATVGDNVYPLGRETDWATRFDPQYAKLRMSTQWQPALGNHDYYAGDLRPYFARFPHLRGQAFYSWSLGPAQFFVLDSEQRLDPDSAQHAWLAEQLARSTAPYRVVQMHRPMISTRAGGIGRVLHGSLGPLLARHGVQLVLAGHDHGYERSRPVDGTVHIVSGGGGAAVYGYAGGPPATSAVRAGRHHHVQLSFDAARMVVRAVDDRGDEFDSTVLLPHPAPAAAPASARGGVAELAR